MPSPIAWLKDGQMYARHAVGAMSRGDCLWAEVNLVTARAAYKHASVEARQIRKPDVRAQVVAHVGNAQSRLRLAEAAFARRCATAPARRR